VTAAPVDAALVAAGPMAAVVDGAANLSCLVYRKYGRGIFGFSNHNVDKTTFNTLFPKLF
jgi:hypothetical protein